MTCTSWNTLHLTLLRAPSKGLQEEHDSRVPFKVQITFLEGRL